VTSTSRAWRALRPAGPASARYPEDVLGLATALIAGRRAGLATARWRGPGGHPSAASRPPGTALAGDQQRASAAGAQVNADRGCRTNRGVERVLIGGIEPVQHHERRRIARRPPGASTISRFRPRSPSGCARPDCHCGRDATRSISRSTVLCRALFTAIGPWSAASPGPPLPSHRTPARSAEDQAPLAVVARIWAVCSHIRVAEPARWRARGAGGRVAGAQLEAGMPTRVHPDRQGRSASG